MKLMLIMPMITRAIPMIFIMSYIIEIALTMMAWQLDHLCIIVIQITRQVRTLMLVGMMKKVS